ncbi:hypothetical protein [Sulfurovum sp.]|uniref:hypothetical protein n=1 Tax=Sulfurovum sp. TaxID=1969726 RepID=UPI0025EAAF43|nr:hypothetical protein [Sulfurovum sp.]
MNLKKHQNELIALLALLLMLTAFFYKNAQVSSGAKQAGELKQSVNAFKEIVALKRVWADKKISKKLDKLKELMPASKVKWSKKGKKLTATYTGLSASELNKLTTKIMNLAVQIQLLDIQKVGSSYNVEFKCKW